MAESAADDRFRRLLERLVEKLDPQSRLLHAWDLKGGISAQVTALEVEQSDGTRKKLILRQHGDADLKGNPQIAADESKLLHHLHDAGLPVPKPYFLDQSREIFPNPCLIIEYVDGTTEFAPADLSDLIAQISAHLSAVHKLEGSAWNLAFLPEQAQRIARKLKFRPTQLDDTLDEGRIRDVLESVWSLPQRNQPVLLHGDFWPGNLLWNEGRLVAIIDWEDAAIGDPLSDFANTRLEILWAYGVEALRLFTRHYKTALPDLDFTDLPYWDLCAALRPASKLSEWAGDAATEKRMRERHKGFVERAFEQLTRR